MTGKARAHCACGAGLPALREGTAVCAACGRHAVLRDGAVLYTTLPIVEPPETPFVRVDPGPAAVRETPRVVRPLSLPALAAGVVLGLVVGWLLQRGTADGITGEQDRLRDENRGLFAKLGERDAQIKALEKRIEEAPEVQALGAVRAELAGVRGERDGLAAELATVREDLARLQAQARAPAVPEPPPVPATAESPPQAHATEVTPATAWRDVLTVEGTKPVEPARKPFRRFADRFIFPPRGERRNWESLGPEYKSVVESVDDQNAWRQAVSRVEKRLAPLDPAWTVRVILEGNHESALAAALRQGDEGKIYVFLGSLIENRRFAEELRRDPDPVIQVRRHRITQREDRILDHELTHILQGERAHDVPLWFCEGLACWVADDLTVIAVSELTKSEVWYLRDDVSGLEAYARGMLFFKWLESVVGKVGIQRLYRQVFVDGAEWRKAVEKATGATWARILDVERWWSRHYAKTQLPRVLVFGAK